MRDKDFRAPWSQRECHQIELDANFTKDMELDTNGTKEEEEAVHVFYHIFAKAHASLPSALVSEQLATLAEAHCKRPLYINYVLVGQAWNSRAISESGLNCSRCHKAAEIPVGNEIFTLQLLHDHCRKNPATLAAYIHDKGSFHPSGPNTVLRRFLTTSVASRECLGLPETCTVCSGRFSPLPHPHYPGNMWTARCSYIEKLMPPLGFEAAMKKFVLQHLSASPMGGLRQNGDNELLGAGRFAAEHWMTSHPSVVPCDVYPGAYDWGYYHITEDMVKGLWLPQLHVGARFSLQGYSHRGWVVPVKWLAWRQLEWQHLYNMQPANLTVILGSNNLSENNSKGNDIIFPENVHD